MINFEEFCSDFGEILIPFQAKFINTASQGLNFKIIPRLRGFGEIEKSIEAESRNESIFSSLVFTYISTRAGQRLRFRTFSSKITSGFSKF